MGHAIQTFIDDKREDILPCAQEFAYYNEDRLENPDGTYHGDMTIHDYPVCKNYDEALSFIERKDRGFYDDHAVQFVDTDGVVRWLLKVEVHC